MNQQSKAVDVAIGKLQDESRTKFLRAHDHDGDAAVIAAMQNPAEIASAISRLSKKDGFPRAMADYIMARRSGDNWKANGLALNLLWDVENEVAAECRRKLAGQA